MSYAFVSFHADVPDDTFYAVQALMLGGAVLSLAHALRERRRSGSAAALLTLAGCFVYGLVVDVSAYYTSSSFRHAEFTVMFLNNRLPLYIALFYPAFMYPVYMTVRRFALPRIVEAFGVGFYGGATYLIFDNLGPLLRWWRWDTSSSFNKPFVDSVPLTSYVWFFTFTAAFAYVARRLFWRGATPRRAWVSVLATPVLTYLGGAVLFIPFDVLAACHAYTAEGVLYVLTMAAAGWALWHGMRSVVASRDDLLALFPLAWVLGLAMIYAATQHLWRHPGERPVGNVTAVALGAALSVAITLAAHPRRATG